MAVFTAYYFVLRTIAMFFAGSNLVADLLRLLKGLFSFEGSLISSCSYFVLQCRLQVF